jgi:hypothetical protein
MSINTDFFFNSFEIFESNFLLNLLKFLLIYNYDL